MKKKLNRKTKNIIKIAIVICGILLIIVALVSLLLFNKQEEDHEEFNSLQELLAAFDCTYIRETGSDLTRITTDIYVILGQDLYTGQTSNERYFTDLIQAIAKLKRYENFRLLDEEKDIEIITLGNEDKTMVTRIYINGDKNYFGNHDSENSLQSQTTEKITPMQITSNEIQGLIDNQWRRTNVNFGTRETIYEDYWYYFDEGIEVRTIAAKVYNIIFRKNYQGQVIQGITPNMTIEQVIERLGTPTFGEEGSRVIGYKGEEIYLFVSDSGISVYPKVSYETEEFIKIVRDIPEDMTAEELLNKITTLWNDYDKYEYSLTNYICLRYSLKGVQIQFNMENNHGIVFYNNYEGNFGEGLTRQVLQEDSSKIPDRFYFEEEDLVYEAELERYDEDTLIHSAEGYSSLRRQATEDFYATIEKVNGVQKNLRVISKTRQYADSDVELDTQILSFLWLDNETIAYSVKNRGIYLYHAKEYRKEQVLQTTEDCTITKYENGRLYYNQTSIKIN